MSDDNESSTRNYFDTFKMGGLAYTQNGNIAEYSKKQLKEGAGPFLRDAASQIYYADGSDMLGNRGFIVSFLHVPSEDYVHFKAFINSFNETYSSDWSSDSVYGRTDPIKMFKQTTRSITLSLIVPASSEGEGFENLGKVQQLLSYLYPSYEKVDNALTISQSPLVRMRIMNLIRKTKVVGVKPEEGAEPVQGQQAYGKYQYERGSYSDHKSAVENRSKSAASKGLLGIIKNVSVNHNMDNPDLGSFILADGVVVPRAIEVTLDFDVLHEHTLGWDGDKFSDVMFPYGVHDDEAMKEELLTQQNQTAAASAVQAQIKRFEETGKLEDVVDMLIEETMLGCG